MLNIVRHRNIHHFQIALRPLLRQALQSLIAGNKAVVAQMGVGAVPVVEVRIVVVIGGGIISLPLQLAADGQKQGLLDGHAHAHTLGGGNQPHHIGEFSRSGTAAPGGLVVVRKADALGGKAVERGRSFRVDGLGRESLRRYQNQVFPFEEAGILVFSGRGQGGQIGVDLPDGAVGILVFQRLKIQALDLMEAVFRRLGRFRFPGILFRGPGLGRLGRFGNRHLQLQLPLRGTAAPDSFQCDAHVQAKGPDGLIKAVGSVQFIPVCFPKADQTIAQSVASKDCQRKHSPDPPAHGDGPGENSIEDHRKQHQQDTPGSRQDQAERHARKVRGNALRSPQHHAGGHIILIGVHTEEFRQIEYAEQEVQGKRHPLAPPFSVKQAVQQPRKAAEAQREGQHGAKAQRFQIFRCPKMQQQLTVYRHSRRQQPTRHRHAPHFFSDTRG